MSNKKPDFWDWLDLERYPDFLRARWVGKVLGLMVFALIALAIGAAIATLWRAVTGDSGGLSAGAVIVTVLGAPFVIWRAVVAQKTVDIAEQSHITDQINTAVEGLGAEKTVKRVVTNKDGTEVTRELTEPNLEVRIGAIFALERIARHHLTEHIQIMEILTAYIRHNAPAKDAPDVKGWSQRFSKWRKEHREAVAQNRPRADIQTALTVIGRRGPDQRQIERGDGIAEDDFKTKWRFRLDLSETCLIGADLQDGHFARANFSDANAQGAYFTGVNAQGADFNWTDFLSARLQDIDLSETNLPTSQIASAFGDGSVNLPEGVERPAHWPEDVLDWEDFEAEYKKWLADKANYIPPEPGKDAAGG